MRLARLHIKNFRGTRELEVDFESDMTVIVGPNGSGKTAILDALTTVANWSLHESGALDIDRADKFEFSNNDIRAGEESAWLILEYDVGDGSVGSVERKTVKLQIVISDDDQLEVYNDDLEAAFNAAVEFSATDTLIVYYRQERGFCFGRRNSSSNWSLDTMGHAEIRRRSLAADMHALGDLSTWWDARDAQEARRVRDRDTSYRDPKLKAVRSAINKVDGFLGVAFHLIVSPPGLHFQKENVSVHVNALSGGERSYIVLLADLACRLQAFVPNKPLSEISATVLIDEVELNLHPGWQGQVLSTLREAFPSCQFILTTHSPQVLSCVKARMVRVIEEEVPGWSRKTVRPQSTMGRTSNYLLEGVLGATNRAPAAREAIRKFNDAIDRRDVDEAAKEMDAVKCEVPGCDPDLLVLQKRLRKLRGDA